VCAEKKGRERERRSNISYERKMCCMLMEKMRKELGTIVTLN